MFSCRVSMSVKELWRVPLHRLATSGVFTLPGLHMSKMNAVKIVMKIKLYGNISKVMKIFIKLMKDEQVRFWSRLRSLGPAEGDQPGVGERI